MNELYPVFLNVSKLNTLLVGAGFVGLEKLTFLLKSSPNARVTVLSKEISDPVRELVGTKTNIELIEDAYHPRYLENRHLVIAATNFPEVNRTIYSDCRERAILVNVADTPECCDLYLGGIVTKGNVKIAISTNGKSPTTAKRLRQLLEDIIPEDINELVENIHKYRETLKGDFEYKVEALNRLTEVLIQKKETV